MVKDDEEVIKGLKLILNHYGQIDYPLDKCKGIMNLNIYKIEIESITGKQNLPE